MFAYGRVVVLLVFTFLTSFEGADAVLCVTMETCILPCKFTPGKDVVIHWIQEKTEANVHSFYRNQDQFGNQNSAFKGRTRLFLDQVFGNASLRLTGVTVQDQGTYKCYVGTNNGPMDHFVRLDVKGPVRRVDIKQEEDTITCSSEGIYPRPKLTWSTRPPSNHSLQNTSTVQQTAEQLYSISSSLTAAAAALDYICTVSTEGNNRTATLGRPTFVIVNSAAPGTTISCTSSLAAHTGLIWRFNHSGVILNQTGTSHAVSPEWIQHVDGSPEGIQLPLKNLSSDQEGLYTCELSNAEETYVTSTSVRLQRSPRSNAAGGIAGVVIGVVLLVLVTFLVVFFYCRRKTEGIL
ncbi:uncharacterized protein hhla2b.2 isoform 2-T2 [Spinachia spinachia]